jgi:hypothetical protein
LVVVGVIARPFDEVAAAGAGAPGVEEGFHMEVLLAVDGVGRRGVAARSRVSGAGPGFEGGDVDGRVVAQVRGKGEVVGDWGEGFEDAVGSEELGT